MMRGCGAISRAGRARKRGRLVALPAAVLLATAGLAAPSAADEGQHDRAQAAYHQSLDLYKAGKYHDAVAKLEEARSLDPTAKELPYNLGLVHEKLGEIDEAIRYFRIYVSMETDEGERERVQAVIKRLEGARKDVTAKPAPSASAPVASAAPPAPPPPAPPTKKGRLDRWVYAAGGAAIVFVGVGAGFGVSALSTKPTDPKTAPGGKTIADLDADAHTAHARAIDADVFFGLGIASAAGAALLYFLRDAEPSEAPATSFVPVLAPRRDGLTGGLGVTF